MLVAYPSWRNNYNNFGLVSWDCLALQTAQFTKTAAAQFTMRVKVFTLNLVSEWIHVGVKSVI